MLSVTNKRAGYDHQNRDSARVILADVERYGGEESLAVQWARVVVGDGRKDPNAAATQS
jgi:hypothetical protein